MEAFGGAESYSKKGTARCGINLGKWGVGEYFITKTISQVSFYQWLSQTWNPFQKIFALFQDIGLAFKPACASKFKGWIKSQ